MPKIGMRIIKSSLAVGVCFLISLIRPEGIVFYSCIAAVLCIQQDVAGSKQVAMNRVKGTLLGGSLGMLALMIEKSCLPMDTLLPRYLMITLMIIPVIYLTVLLHMTSASYISCVVFMSVSVSHGMDVNPFLFGVNRMVDTLIGIFVALGFNTIHLHNRRNTKVLFVSDLDHTLLLENGTLSAYTKVKLKQLLEQGASITIATSRTPATCFGLLQDIQFPLPIIVMNGAAMYDVMKQEYVFEKSIDPLVFNEVMSIFDAMQVNCFVHSIIHHVLHVYYGKFQNPVEEDYYHAMRKTPYKSYVYSRLPDEQTAVVLHAIHESALLQQVYERIRLLPVYDQLHLVMRKDEEHQGYSILDVYSKDAGKKQAVDELLHQHRFSELYVFGDDVEDLPLMGSADRSFAVKNARPEIKAHATLVGSNEDDGVIQVIDQEFHRRKKRALSRNDETG